MGLIFNQRGVSIIAVVIMMLIMAVMGSVLLSMVGTENTSSLGQMRGSQAFFVAEGGVEYTQRFLTDTANWYFFPTDPYPQPSVTMSLGAGTFTYFVNFPATGLSKNLGGGSGNTTVCTFSTDRFPSSATIEIDNEVLNGCVPGNPASCNGPGFNCNTRPYQGTLSAHAIGAEVYPVTTLSANITSSQPTITVGNTAKFLAAGTIQIGDAWGITEEARYNGITPTQFLGVVRGVNGTTATAWPAGTTNVTPLQNTGTAPDDQVLVTSTGNVSNASRVLQSVAQQ